MPAEGKKRILFCLFQNNWHWLVCKPNGNNAGLTLYFDLRSRRAKHHYVVHICLRTFVSFHVIGGYSTICILNKAIHTRVCWLTVTCVLVFSHISGEQRWDRDPPNLCLSNVDHVIGFQIFCVHKCVRLQMSHKTVVGTQVGKGVCVC